MSDLAAVRLPRHARRTLGEASPPTRAASKDARLLRQLTEALADGDPIQWAGVRRAARTVAARRQSRQLELIAAMARPPASATTTEISRRCDPWTRVLVGLAGVVVASSVSLWLDTAAPGARAGRAAVVVSTAAAATLAGAFGATRLARAAHVVLWLVAALLARPLGAAPNPLAATSRIAVALTHVPIEAALPWALWAMACATPGIARFGRVDRLCRSVRGAALAWSGLLALATWLAVALPDGVPVSLHPVWIWRLQETAGPGRLALLVWAAAATAAMLVRVDHAARRDGDPPAPSLHISRAPLRLGVALIALSLPTAWLIAGWFGLGGSAMASGATSLDVGSWPWIGLAGLAPWVIAGPIVWGAIARPSHARVALRRQLAIATLLAAGCALVSIGLRASWLRQQVLTDVASDPMVALAAGCGGALWLLLAGTTRAAGEARSPWRWRSASDAWVAGLAHDLRHARTPREVASRVTARLAADVNGIEVALLFPGTAGWQTIVGPTITLAHDSAVATMLAGAGDAPLCLGPGASLRALLPRDDVAWLDRHGVHVLVPIAALDGPPRAALLVARAIGGGTPGRVAVAAASVAAATTAMALERCAALSEITAPDDVAFECGACGRLDAVPGTCPCGTTRHLAALPSMFASRYRLDRRLGTGGMGVVYVATDVTLGRRVALKTLPCADAAHAAALQVEAQAMAAVPHPGVVVLYGLERWRGTPVLVMEYFERGTLADLAARGPMPWRGAVTLGTILARTLAGLHRRHWVHRDIKPANIALDDSGRPVLLDLGLTRLLDGAALRAMPGPAPSPVEVTPALAGTRAYLSPEALDGADVGPHDDVWALATVICELLLGHRPCDAAVSDAPDVSPMLRHVGVPAAVADVLGRALHPCSDRRLCRADDLARALGAAARVA